ncbi:uncharacterized protein F5Z01DRAFT_731324 [Emericellopsis atlantica]|uniref:Uncharacterized protein n=1 Tax=Emericellopsis atlantica TaxID=2614577 RepID=A0A9P7ZDZ7_9HYPO|nr:uncharacterized protein F5Z01DRAFT_731324 [Emericellopsis atlantica]KAG9249981.1 hypothetical protein F5Z01DRAFT_731324 [Emericellopsis atlantica]
MDADSSVNDWTSDEASESPPSDFPDDDDQSRRVALTRKSQLRPAGLGLAFVPYADWRPTLPYNEQPPECIRYNVEWKLSVNNRQRSGESEPGVVISPQRFWKHVLRSKKPPPKPWGSTETKIVLSVTDRKTGSITKRFPELKVDWSYVAKQLQDWSHFLRDGKKLSAQVVFYYEECGKTAPAARGATATQLAETNARNDAEVAVLGRPDSWREVIALVRCPGPPCDKGPYCWQDGQRHYKLLGHHLKILVDEAQKGHSMRTHDDIPERVRQELYAEEQQQGERKRKRQCRDSGSRSASPPVIHIHNIPSDADATRYGTEIPSTPEMVFSTSPTFDFQALRDDTVKAYVAWQRSKIGCQEQEGHFNQVQELTLDHGLDLDLDMVYTNRGRYYRFYKEYGVLEGVAWRFVCDIKCFMTLHNTAETIANLLRTDAWQ